MRGEPKEQGRYGGHGGMEDGGMEKEKASPERVRDLFAQYGILGSMFVRHNLSNEKNITFFSLFFFFLGGGGGQFSELDPIYK